MFCVILAEDDDQKLSSLPIPLKINAVDYAIDKEATQILKSNKNFRIMKNDYKN